MFVCPQHSLDRLKNPCRPSIGVPLPTVYVPTANVKSERKYVEKHLSDVDGASIKIC